METQKLRVLRERKGAHGGGLESQERILGSTQIDGHHVRIGGRQEIANAVRYLATEAAAGRLDPEKIDEAAIERHLATVDIPDPDLLIRTSGEQRISNFLLWQCAYTELVFLDVLWPDFERAHLEEAIREFNGRDRRFGGSAG